MTDRETVANFINNYKTKLAIWDVAVLDRKKNTQTLLDLEIRPKDRKSYLESIKVEDFSEGPLDENLFMGSDMWVFGQEINNQLVYIKITLGRPSLSTLCISFHIAEFPMNLPFKKQK